jgi:hypothetical protein
METLTELNWRLLFTPTHPNQVFENHIVSYNAPHGTWNAITLKKADNKDMYGWWTYWRHQDKHFLQGESRKIKDNDWQNIYILQAYSVAFYLKCKHTNSMISIPTAPGELLFRLRPRGLDPTSQNGEFRITALTKCIHLWTRY